MQAQSVSAHNQLEKLVDDNSANWSRFRKIWDFAELGYHEEKLISLAVATEGGGLHRGERCGR